MVLCSGSSQKKATAPSSCSQDMVAWPQQWCPVPPAKRCSWPWDGTEINPVCVTPQAAQGWLTPNLKSQTQSTRLWQKPPEKHLHDSSG